MNIGSHMGGAKSPKLVFEPFFHKMSPKRLILLNESAETSCVISSEVNPNMGVLIRGLFTTKVFIARRTVVSLWCYCGDYVVSLWFHCSVTVVSL